LRVGALRFGALRVGAFLLGFFAGVFATFAAPRLDSFLIFFPLDLQDS
jgi:hypothetical protein